MDGGEAEGDAAFNAHLAHRYNKIDVLIHLNLRTPVS